jgi:uncharacterized protein
MPIVTSTTLIPPTFQWDGHSQTLIPGMLRSVPSVRYQRERISTPDGDFLDLDWIRHQRKQVVILTHGLEGNSERQYMRGTAQIFNARGWDVLAWNCRSCSGEMNKQFRLYYHGDIEDITTVVNHARRLGYQKIALVGFSMGGNITLKYLGVNGSEVPSEICGGVAFSAPVDLKSASDALDFPRNWMYRRHFLRKLKRKITLKAEQFPLRIDIEKFNEIKVWRDFDEWFSAPLCQLRNAEQFYRESSARNFVGGIKVPTLLVNAENDPILTPPCFPTEEARQHPYFHFQSTTNGGHCGFMEKGHRQSWAERRAFNFINDINGQ